MHTHTPDQEFPASCTPTSLVSILALVLRPIELPAQNPTGWALLLRSRLWPFQHGHLLEGLAELRFKGRVISDILGERVDDVSRRGLSAASAEKLDNLVHNVVDCKHIRKIGCLRHSFSFTDFLQYLSTKEDRAEKKVGGRRMGKESTLGRQFSLSFEFPQTRF